MINLQRHDFIWLNDKGWSQLIAQYKHGALQQWQKSDWPLIICQQLPSRRQGYIMAGLPLPPAKGKQRIGLEILPEYIKQSRPAPKLIDVKNIAPPSWWGGMQQLLALSLSFRVFGSIAWQYFTKLEYLSNISDCDLLLNMHEQSHNIGFLLGQLALIQKSVNFTLDCELQTKNEAVHFQELLQENTPDILVKTLYGVKIMPKQLWLLENA